MTDHQIYFHAPGLVLFLEEDLYLTKDTLHTLRMLDSKRTNEEDMIVMGSREPIQWAIKPSQNPNDQYLGHFPV